LSGRAGRGAPLIDQNVNREVFEESVEILFNAFEGKVLPTRGYSVGHVVGETTAGER
jgi:hypothetical protein